MMIQDECFPEFRFFFISQTWSIFDMYTDQAVGFETIEYFKFHRLRVPVPIEDSIRFYETTLNDDYLIYITECKNFIENQSV